MKKSPVPWIVVVAICILILVGGWYWWTMKESLLIHPAPQTNMQSSFATTSPLTLVLAETSTTLGKYLIAANGRTLYRYTKDARNTSNCSGSCMANWSPYSIPGDIPIGAPTGIVGQIGAIRRADKMMQLTYKGVPLYFFRGDTKAGGTKGQGIGGMWFVIKP